jgi:hypothetical protein
VINALVSFIPEFMNMYEKRKANSFLQFGQFIFGCLLRLSEVKPFGKTDPEIMVRNKLKEFYEFFPPW